MRKRTSRMYPIGIIVIVLGGIVIAWVSPMELRHIPANVAVIVDHEAGVFYAPPYLTVAEIREKGSFSSQKYEDAVGAGYRPANPNTIRVKAPSALWYFVDVLRDEPTMLLWSGTDQPVGYLLESSE